MASAWSLDIAPEYCINTEKFYTANAALNIASDLMILVLPAPIVWNLNTDVRKKIILTGLFSMGWSLRQYCQILFIGADLT